MKQWVAQLTIKLKKYALILLEKDKWFKFNF